MLTGTLFNLSRDEAKDRLEAVEPRWQGSVSKKTYMSWPGPEAGSNSTNAQLGMAS